MVIVDTSVWIDFLNQRETPQTLWLRDAHGSEMIGLTSLVLTEVLQGIRYDVRFRQAQQYFRTLPVFDAFSSEVAVQAAQNFRALRSLGITIRSTIDCLSATFCIGEGFTLLHSDADFNHFAQHLGLAVVRV